MLINFCKILNKFITKFRVLRYIVYTLLTRKVVIDTDVEILRKFIHSKPHQALAMVNAIEDSAVRESLLKNWTLWRREGQKLELKDIDNKYEQILLLCGRA